MQVEKEKKSLIFVTFIFVGQKIGLEPTTFSTTIRKIFEIM